MTHHPRGRLAALGLLAPLVIACGPDDPAPAAGSSLAPATGAGHGEVAGAVEVDEPPVGLTTVDASGLVRHLDLLDESVSPLADLGPLEDQVASVHTDGRYVFVGTDEGVAVVDSGAWTWDHVDHVHYYRTTPRVLGLVAGRGPASVATTTSSTSGSTGVFFAGSGEAVLLDTEAMAEGTLTERFRVEVEPHDGLLVPVGDDALLTQPADARTAGRVVALDPAGEPRPGRSWACGDAAGTIATRVGTVIGCDDGALLVTSDGDGTQVERITYPRGTTRPAATDFAGRAGRPTVAALAGPDHVWLLDTRERSWRLLDSPVKLAQVTAVDDEDEHVLGLTTDGRVAVLDGGSGDLLARTRPLAAESLGSGTGRPALVVDQQRAYLSLPAEKRLVEIDFVDDARIARTFDTETEPLLTAGTGR